VCNNLDICKQPGAGISSAELSILIPLLFAAFVGATPPFHITTSEEEGERLFLDILCKILQNLKSKNCPKGVWEG